MEQALEQRLDNNSASIPEQRSIEIYTRGAVELYTMPLGRLPPSESLLDWARTPTPVFKEKLFLEEEKTPEKKEEIKLDGGVIFALCKSTNNTYILKQFIPGMKELGPIAIYFHHDRGEGRTEEI